jgi:hypothetical protein
MKGCAGLWQRRHRRLLAARKAHNARAKRRSPRAEAIVPFILFLTILVPVCLVAKGSGPRYPRAATSGTDRGRTCSLASECPSTGCVLSHSDCGISPISRCRHQVAAEPGHWFLRDPVIGMMNARSSVHNLFDALITKGSGARFPPGTVTGSTDRRSPFQGLW